VIPVVEDFEYVFTIEVAAANCRPVRRDYRLPITPRGQHAKRDALGGAVATPLPNVTFLLID
jgi:hypothetical protein